MKRGSLGSGSSLARIFAMCTSMERSKASACPLSASRICSRDSTRPAARARVARSSNSWWMRGGRAPQESADAGEELPWIERLGEIVVGAHLEPHHLVHIFALGGEHDHGQGGAVGEGADPAAYLEAVHAGEHDVEEHDVGPALVEDGETPRAVARQGHVDLVLA